MRVRNDHKPVPKLLHPEDAIVRVTRSCICGSDLHLYNADVPDTRTGMTFGHEFTDVVEVSSYPLKISPIGASLLRAHQTTAEVKRRWSNAIPTRKMRKRRSEARDRGRAPKRSPNCGRRAPRL